MKTKHLYAAESGALEEAVALLKAGQLIAFPTDTLYGVGVDAFNAEAIETLYRVKERPRMKGIPILLANAGDINKVAADVPALAAELIERFWPGPLTLIVPRKVGLPENLSPNENVAVRIPDNDVARELIHMAGGALATSSANRSGEDPARDAAQALTALGGSIAAVVDGGSAPYGMPSTIVDCTTTPPRILRSGPLSAAELSLEKV
jgi:L-threonylcarbamoyladenylate synthase